MNNLLFQEEIKLNLKKIQAMSQLFSFHEKNHCPTPACLIFCANSRSHEYLFYHNGSLHFSSTSLFASAIQRTLN